MLSMHKDNATYHIWEYALKWSLAGPFMFNWYALNQALLGMKNADALTEVKNIVGTVAFLFYSFVQMKFQISSFAEFAQIIGDHEAAGKRMPFTEEEMEAHRQAEAEAEANGEDEDDSLF